MTPLELAVEAANDLHRSAVSDEECHRRCSLLGRPSVALLLIHPFLLLKFYTFSVSSKKKHQNS